MIRASRALHPQRGHGYEQTGEAAMAAIAKNWRRD
jgi:hypothetical protein